MRGLPVIAADIGGLPELVDTDRGRLFPSGDSDRLLTVIADLLDQPAKHESMRKSALEWVREHTMSDHIDRLLDCYER